MAQELIESPKQNYILAALSNAEYARHLDDLELVSLSVGQLLSEPGDALEYAYFPTTSVVSLIFTTKDGVTAELAMTGREGLVGVGLVLGGSTATHRVVVQYPGKAYRVRAEVMRWELAQGGGLQQLSLRYAQFLLTQMSQNIVCNRHHSIDHQLARWLLLSLDRVPGNQLNMTQERIAYTLGVRREGVTEAAGKLQSAGLIEYRRGHITVISRTGLEARVCECYSTMKPEQDVLSQMMPDAHGRDRIQNHFREHLRQNPETLRQRAEAHLLRCGSATPAISSDDTRMLHELQVHQIELEMQNDELRSAYTEAETIARRYADIYDFAPLSYFTLNRQGVILDLNLAGAILIGIKRNEKSRKRFVASISPAFRMAFQNFMNETLCGKTRHSCDVELLPTSQNAAARIRIEAVPDDDMQELRMVVMNLPPERRVEPDWGNVTINRRNPSIIYASAVKQVVLNAGRAAGVADTQPERQN